MDQTRTKHRANSYAAPFHGLGEDVSGGSLGRVDHMGIDPKRDCGVSVAQPGGDDVNGTPESKVVA